MNETRQSIVGSHKWRHHPFVRKERLTGGPTRVRTQDGSISVSRGSMALQIRICPAKFKIPWLPTTSSWPIGLGNLKVAIFCGPPQKPLFQVPGGNARSTNFDLIFSTYNYPYWLSASPSNPTQSFTNQGQNLK